MHILLDSFKIGANVITYNGFNPATWKNFAFNLVGRMLMSVNDGTRTIGFEYNHEGLRTKKIVGSLVKNYYYEGLKLLRESTPYYDIDFDFNEYDELIGFKYNQDQYYYVRDVLRNILGIVDTNGNLVVKYRYDAWGNHQVLNTTDTVITAGASTGILEATKLFPKTGNFKRDFVNNLRFYASEDVIYKAGAGIISSSVTGFLAYLSLPSANTIRKY